MNEKEIRAIEKEHKKVLKEQARYYRQLKVQERHNRKVARELKKMRL